MKKLLLIVFLPCFLFASQQTLNGNLSGLTIAATDTITVGGNSTIDASGSFVAFWLPSGQTYTLAVSGSRTLTLSGNNIFWKDSTSGTKTYPSIVANGNGVMRISSGSGTIASGSELTFNGIDTLNDNKGVVWGPLNVGSLASLAINGAVSNSSGPINFADSGNLMLTRQLSMGFTTNRKYFGLSGRNPTITLNANTFFNHNAANTVDTMPGLTIAGSGTMTIRPAGSFVGCKSHLGGNFRYLGPLTIRLSNASSALSFYTNGYSLSTGAFNFGSGNATGTTISLNLSNSTLNCLSINFATDNLGTIYDSLGSATINDSTDFTLGSGHTLVSGTSTLKFIGGAKSTFTAIDSNRVFYNIEIAKTASAACSTAGTTSLKCNEFRITSGRAVINCPLICNSYLNLSTDTSVMLGDKYIATSFYRASTANTRVDTFKNYFVTNVNHDISCDTNVTLGRFIVQAGRATALTNLRMVKFTLPVASKLTIAAGKVVRIDSTYDLEGAAGSLDSVISGTPASQAKLWLPANDSMSYVYFKDINSIDTIFADSTCRDGGNNTNIFFPVTCIVPTITTHPQSTSTLAPATANFSVAATGDTPLSYQWQKGTANISGATNSSYTTPATSTADDGATFRAIVSNSCGVDTSNEATLTVTCVKTISVNPNRGDTAGGTALTFYLPYCGGLTGSTCADVDSYNVTSDSTATGTSKAHATGAVIFNVVLTGGDTLKTTFTYRAPGQQTQAGYLRRKSYRQDIYAREPYKLPAFR